MTWYLLDKNNKPYKADFPQAAKELTNAMRRVGLYIVLDGGGKHEIARVSTVFLGLDHGYNSDVPILFETRVQSTYDCPYNEEMERYATYDEARAGHEKWVKCLQEWADECYPKPQPQLPALKLKTRRNIDTGD